MISAATGELVIEVRLNRQNGLRRKVMPAAHEGQWPPANHRVL